ncbi:MAG: hypothetical protein KAH09_04115 [Desulfobacula sp.]|nr:hypothetical protein [Desulfobacula sp.]
MFKRLFKVTESNINSAIDQLEDPIKMTEQSMFSAGIRITKKPRTCFMRTALSPGSPTCMPPPAAREMPSK